MHGAGYEAMQLLLDAMAEARVQPPAPKIPRLLTKIPPEVIQLSPTSLLVHCDSEPQVHLVVSLVT